MVQARPVGSSVAHSWLRAVPHSSLRAVPHSSVHFFDVADSACRSLRCGRLTWPARRQWARARINGARDPDAEYWLLARRSLADPTEIAYHLTHGPKRVALADLARAAGARWVIEESFQTSKGQTGLDHYQVRQYTGRYRHITLSMLAHTFLTVTRSKKGANIQTTATSSP